MTTTTPPTQTESETLVNRIIAELRADPVAHDMLLKALLTGEFLGIPTRLERIEERQQRTEEWQQRTDTRLDRTEEWQQRTEEWQQRTDTRLDRTEEWQQRTEEWQQRTEEWQQRTETRLDRIEERQQRTEEWQQRTETRLDRLETTVSDLKTTVSDLATTVRSLDGRVGNLEGKDYEAELSDRIMPLLSDRIGLTRPRLIHCRGHRMNHELYDQLEDAVEENLIDPQQRLRITRTDIIVRARRKSDGAWVWIAVEASLTIRRDDIDRARQSAQALAAAFSEHAIAAAVGQRIPDPETQYAQTIGVEPITG